MYNREYKRSNRKVGKRRVSEKLGEMRDITGRKIEILPQKANACNKPPKICHQRLINPRNRKKQKTRSRSKVMRSVNKRYEGGKEPRWFRLTAGKQGGGRYF